MTWVVRGGWIGLYQTRADTTKNNTSFVNRQILRVVGDTVTEKDARYIDDGVLVGAQPNTLTVRPVSPQCTTLEQLYYHLTVVSIGHENVRSDVSDIFLEHVSQVLHIFTELNDLSLCDYFHVDFKSQQAWNTRWNLENRKVDSCT